MCGRRSCSCRSDSFQPEGCGSPDYNAGDGGAQRVEQQIRLREDGVRTAAGAAANRESTSGPRRHYGGRGARVHGVRGLELHRSPLYDGDHPDHGRVQGGAPPRHNGSIVDHASPRNGGRHALLRCRLLRGARGGGRDRGYFGRRRMQTAIGKLSDHYILCGYGRVGRQVAAEFARDGVPFVVVDQDPEIVEEAGVRRAKGLVAAVDSDADNVFVVLSARKLNPRLNIVARASSDESAAKLEMAGADRTLSPYAVGGRRLASLATQPLIVDFLEIVTRGEEGIEFRLEEFSVPKDSFIAGHTIGELQIGEKTGV